VLGLLSADAVLQEGGVQPVITWGMGVLLLIFGILLGALIVIGSLILSFDKLFPPLSKDELADMDDWYETEWGKED
jgi:hypothetical protein